MLRKAKRIKISNRSNLWEWGKNNKSNNNSELISWEATGMYMLNSISENGHWPKTTTTTRSGKESSPKAEISCRGRFRKIRTHYDKCKRTMKRNSLLVMKRKPTSRSGIKKLPLRVLKTWCKRMWVQRKAWRQKSNFHENCNSMS